MKTEYFDASIVTPPTDRYVIVCTVYEPKFEALYQFSQYLKTKQ
jgi:hypothetical protein